MSANQWITSVSVVALGVLLATGPTLAQQVTGSPGSPSATTTIEGSQLPPPPQEFKGKIERNAAQSTPYWPMRVVPPKGAPNILLIMTTPALVSPAHSAASFRHRLSIASPPTVCALRTSIRQ